MGKNMGTGNGRLLARISLTVAALFALFALAGCSQLTINTNTSVNAELTPTLKADATIAEGVLTVGINGTNSPYGGTSPSGSTVGLDVDIAAALAQEMGMKLQIVDVSSNGKSALSTGQVDVALGVMKSGSNNTIAYSNAYINDGTSLFTLKDNAEKAQKEAKNLGSGSDKVLVQGKTATALEVQEAIGTDAVVGHETLKDAFAALENGEGAYLVADAVAGDYLATNYSDIVRVNYINSESVRPMYAVTLTDKVEVTQAVGKALDSITANGVLRLIVDKWLGTQGEDLLPGKVDISKIPDMFDTKTKDDK